MWFIIKSDNIGKKSEDSRDLQMNIKKGKDWNVKYYGVGQMGTIMLEFQWNSIKESNGWANLSRPMYDQPLWNSGDSWFEAPTVRGVASVVFEIVGEVSGQKWFSYADDVIFATIDLGGGFKSAEEVGLELAKTAATAVISYGCSAAGSAASTAASKALEGSSKIGNFAAQAGISAAQSYITTVGSSTVNNMYWDTENGKIGYNTDGFVQSLYSGATIGSALGAGITSGLNLALTTDGNGIALNNKLVNKVGLNSISSLAGSATAAAVEYAMDGKTTVNLLNTSMFGLKNKDGNSINIGLFELGIDKDEGLSGKIGMGGHNMNLGLIAQAMGGLKDAGKIVGAGLAEMFGDKTQISTINAANMLSYTGDANLGIAKEIWDENINVEYRELKDDNGLYTHSTNTITLSSSLIGGGKEESAKLATVMAHEGSHANGVNVEALAHANGLQTYSAINTMFGLNGDTNFSNQMLAGIMAPENWKENTGDVEHWRIVKDSNGKITDIKDDGDREHLNVVDENGKAIETVDFKHKTLTGEIAALGTDGQTAKDINDMMYKELGFDYEEGKGWFAVKDSAVYQEPEITDSSNSGFVKTLADAKVMDMKYDVAIVENIVTKVKDWITGKKEEKKEEIDKESQEKYNELNDKYKKVKNAKYTDNPLQESFKTGTFIPTEDSKYFNCIGFVCYMYGLSQDYGVADFDKYTDFYQLDSNIETSKLNVGDVITWKYNDEGVSQYHAMIWNGNGSVWEAMDNFGVRIRDYESYKDWMNSNNHNISKIEYYRKRGNK